METINSLKPKVSLEAARRRFSADGVRGLFRQLRLGRLRSLAQVYIPFDSFRVRIERDGTVETALMALDAVTGTLDPYAFEHLPGEADCVAVRTRNLLPRILPPEPSRKNAEERVRRLLYLRGFFRIRTLEITAELQPLSIYVPYWVGFFGADSQLRTAVIDAVRGQTEGAKVRVLLQQWFTGELSPSSNSLHTAAAS
jgi:hypothetical protein